MISVGPVTYAKASSSAVVKAPERRLVRLPEASWRRAALAVAAAAESVRPALARTLYGRAADDLRKRGTKPAREELAEILRRLAVLDREGRI